MMRILTKFKQTKSIINHRFIFLTCVGIFGLFIVFIKSNYTSLTPPVSLLLQVDYRQRPECKCSRPALPPVSSHFLLNEQQPAFCSQYTSRRGPHQRVISISLFGPKEVKKFEIGRSLHYLDLLIKDMNRIYSDGFILRIYHDNTINATHVICPIECKHSNVDFCNMTQKTFIPPKIWRFIPAGDPLVDIMMSRDLDSALTERERSAVNAWLLSNKSFHAMRDHPQHGTPMLGGLWGFRPSLNPNISRILHSSIHRTEVVKLYTGRADQEFLRYHVWPYAKSNILVHDSFFCKDGFGQKPEAFPTERQPANETNCFVGCGRPCCGDGKMPFGECPKECRPKTHPEWIYC